MTGEAEAVQPFAELRVERAAMRVVARTTDGRRRMRRVALQVGANAVVTRDAQFRLWRAEQLRFLGVVRPVAGKAVAVRERRVRVLPLHGGVDTFVARHADGRHRV